ncbi:MAG: serine hydrolase [Alphaproteobacteria bacterium]
MLRNGRRWWAGAVAVALAVGIGGRATAEAPPADDGELLRRIAAMGSIEPDWVTPAARRQLTPELIATVMSQLGEAAGPFEAVAPEGDGWLLLFENASVPVLLSRDENGLVAGLFFREPIPNDLTLDEVVGAIAALPGETAVYVARGDTVLAAHAADAPLLVASSFKLAVMLALREAVDAGDLAWDQVVRYRSDWASVSSGMLHAYPDGHPITVASLAAMMISLSDNTATDVLIRLVGRDHVEAAAGTAPILMTAEYFKLKADPALYRRYLDADLAGQRAIIEEIGAVPLPRQADLANGRIAHGWRLSARSLCALMGAVADLGEMGINTGGQPSVEWDRIAFKGGNDVGVTNLTYMVTPPGGMPVCLSMTWNEPGHFDDATFNSLAGQLLHVLRAGG